MSVLLGNGNGNFTGQVYTIDTIAPFVQSINRTTPAGPVTNASSVSFTVTFSEAVTGVDPTDFQLAGNRHRGHHADPGDAGQRLGLHGHGQRHHRQRHAGPEPGGRRQHPRTWPAIRSSSTMPPAAFQTQQTFATGVAAVLRWRWATSTATASPTSSSPMHAQRHA